MSIRVFEAKIGAATIHVVAATLTDAVASVRRSHRARLSAIHEIKEA